MWYVVWTDTGKEEKMAALLQERLPEDLIDRCWVPKRIERQKRHGVWGSYEKPMFPGYFFIDTPHPEETRAGFSKIPSFQMILRTGEEYVPLTEREEKLVRRLTGDHGHMGISYGTMEDGRLRIVRGPLYGMEKYFTKVDLHKRKVLMEMQLFGELRRIWGAIDFID